MKKKVIAIVGRPNVGKSTLFNKIAGGNIAIIEDKPGVTRDRIYKEINYLNKSFILIDTGGISADKEQFQKDIKVQAGIAIEEADLILFVVDGKEGITSNDLIIRDLLKKSQKKVLVVVNKIDNNIAKDNLYDFYELGFPELLPISAIHNTGYYDLMEKITEDIEPNEKEEDKRIKFCIIGRPNVGKSSLANALLGKDRMVVANIAGTTRDSVDSVFKYHNEEYVLIDTAGMRKKGKIYEDIEKYSYIRSIRAIDRSDICLVVLDASDGIKEHDKHIAGYAIEKGKGLIFVVNKWDMIKDTTKNEFSKLMKQEFKFASYAPIVYVSALTKSGITTIMPEIIRVYQNANRMIKTSVLNEVIMDAYEQNIPPSYKNKRLKIYFSNQSGSAPPKFTLHVNSKQLVHFSYERYLENKLRENFELDGTPIIIQFKNRDGE